YAQVQKARRGMSQRLSEHSTLHEAVRSATATRKGIDNVPDAVELERLRATAQRMERIRALLGNRPVVVTSWFRCEALNAAAGGVPDRAHRLGYAVDFVCPAYGTPLNIARRLVAARVAFDQLIYEYGRWVHVSFDPQMRGEVLTAMPSGYERGLVED